MTPSIKGKTHWFAEHGLYDGLFLMRDEESGTYWDHLTGEAVYGPLVGTNLEITSLNYSLAGQVAENEPDALVSLSEKALRSNDDMELDNLLQGENRRLSGMFSSTVREEDDRLPTMDLGIGVWRNEHARYFSYDQIVAQGNAIIDGFEDRNLLVFLDPAVQVLSAIYVDADSYSWDAEILRLDNGQYISGSILYDLEGEPLKVSRPLQVFTRWYGFALTFPGTEIYGENRD